MSLRKFLISRTFVIQLAIAILIAILILIATLLSLKSYTRHGESYSVPALTGLNIKEAKTMAEATKLRIAVIDSVYNTKFKPGVVVDQIPLANSKVKENRVIRLTINSTQPEKVILPKLSDISFRQAKVLIENCGLLINNIEYEPSEYNDLVLKVQQDSVDIFEGDKIIKGSGIDLIIGRSKGNLKTSLPNLTGFSLDEALMTLVDSKLNTGAVIYDKTVKTKEDSLTAKIWKQLPNPKFNKLIELGSSIDIWFTTDTTKINNAYERY